MSGTDGLPQQNEGEGPLPREIMILLNPDHHIRQRVKERAFLDFVGSVINTIKAYFQEVPVGQGFDLQVACAVLPGDKLLLEFQVQPDGTQVDSLKSLQQRLEQLPRPRVRNGPIAFASRDLIWGGAQTNEVVFSFPFASLAQPGEGRPLDEVLMEAGGIVVKQSWWARVKQALGFGSP